MNLLGLMQKLFSTQFPAKWSANVDAFFIYPNKSMENILKCNTIKGVTVFFTNF